MNYCFLKLCFVASIITFSSQKSTAQDYTVYHLSIIKADEQIFVKSQIKEELNTYTQIFEHYDFVFVSDCVTAIQIALYAKNEKAFLYFVDKATQNGLMPRHVQRITRKEQSHLLAV